MVSISIIVTCYNLEKYIEQALVSCFRQDYAGLMELVIVDDASTDSSVDIIRNTIEKYGKGWDVSFIQRSVNGGISAAMDTAMSKAKYEWCVWADGDDVQRIDRCSKTARLAELFPQAFSIHLSRECINAKGVSNEKFFGPLSVPYDKHPVVFCQNLPAERLQNYKNESAKRIVDYGCSMAIRKELWSLWGPAVPENYQGERFSQDPLWAARAYLTGAAIASKEVACQYRSHESNILNYRRDSRSFSSLISNELYMARYAAKEAAQLQRTLSDIELAKHHAELTDWTTDQLEELKDIITDRLYVKQQGSYWWNKPIWQRVAISFRIRKTVPPSMKFWLVGRAFPLRVYCFIKLLRAILKGK